jgi:hypothetical protein
MTVDNDADALWDFLCKHPSHESYQVGAREITPGYRAWNERRLWDEVVAAGITSTQADAKEALAELAADGRLRIEVDTFDRSDEVGRAPTIGQRIVYVTSNDQLSRP